MKETNIRRATYKVLSNFNINEEFSSHELRNKVTKSIFFETRQIKRPFHDTVLRYLRETNHHGMKFACISREKSLYKRIS